MLNVITGVYRRGGPGAVGRPGPGGTPPTHPGLGVARTFQDIQLFGECRCSTTSVGYHLPVPRPSCSGRSCACGWARAEERTITEAALEALDFVGLADRRNDLARNLPYGQQRRLEVARALAPGARLLLLDGPLAGMNPSESAEMGRLSASCSAEGLILLIEHNMKVVMGALRSRLVLDHGEKIAEGRRPRSSRTRRSSTRTWAGPRQAGAPARTAGGALLALEDVSAGYGAIRPSTACARRARGRGGGPDRRQRRRQDDDPPRDLGAPATAAGRIRSGAASTGSAPRRWSSGRGAGARGAPDLAD